ncbi:inositol monophosphatase [Patescibacteria group bacterium]|nr:inositol monophosphatase [Patescibacteria group bacterium]
MKRETKVIVKAAEAGGEILRKYFGQDLKVVQKSFPSDVYTKADIESETAILNILTKELAGFNIFSEETGEIKKNSDFTLIIDPLDGSNNFVLGIPNFSSTIGLLYKDEIIASVVYDPIQKKTYYAEKGEGAYCNKKKIKVNKISKWEESTVAYITHYTVNRKPHRTIIDRIENKKVKRVLRNWSPALDFCMLASGKVEVVINNYSEIYDHIAGKLIAQEAGARITDFEGKNEKNNMNSIFIASNGTGLHQSAVKLF